MNLGLFFGVTWSFISVIVGVVSWDIVMIICVLVIAYSVLW
jgi:hypothetical protein